MSMKPTGPEWTFSARTLTAPVCMLLVLSAIASAPSHASEEGANMGWIYNAEGYGNGPVLYYGATDNEEFNVLFLTCVSTGGGILIEFIDANESLEVGDEACIDIRAGRAHGRFCGAATPNGMSGIPGAAAIAPVNHDLFEEFRAANRNATFDIASEHQVLSLAGVDSKMRGLLDYCYPNY